MAVSTQIDSVVYAGNGSSVTPYPITFRVLDAAHVECGVRTPELGINSPLPNYQPLVPGEDFIVTLDEETGLGSLTIVDGDVLDNTVQVKISRFVPLTQETEYPLSGPFPAKSHETALDKLTLICQDLARRLDELEALRDERYFPIREEALGEGGDPLGILPDEYWGVIRNTNTNQVALWVKTGDPAGVGAVPINY